MLIWFASGNMHKKKELADILADKLKSTDWELKIPIEAGLEFTPDETGNSFLENALIKAEALYKLLDNTGFYKKIQPQSTWSLEEENINDLVYPPCSSVVISDDSGLCVDALGGRPGIHSARYGDSHCGRYGGAKLTAAEKNAQLLSELGDKPNRKARFVCAMVLYFGTGRFFAAQETMEGELVKTARGEGGFGYDPILFIPQLGRTVAELSEEEKNRISHRGKAGRAIAGMLYGTIKPQLIQQNDSV